MNKVNTSDLKNNLSAILARLVSSGSVLVYDRKTPVAAIHPFNELSPSEGLEGEADWLLSMKKKGILFSKSKKLTEDLINSSPAKLTGPLDVAERKKHCEFLSFDEKLLLSASKEGFRIRGL